MNSIYFQFFIVLEKGINIMKKLKIFLNDITRFQMTSSPIQVFLHIVGFYFPGVGQN